MLIRLLVRRSREHHAHPNNHRQPISYKIYDWLPGIWLNRLRRHDKSAQRYSGFDPQSPTPFKMSEIKKPDDESERNNLWFQNYFPSESTRFLDGTFLLQPMGLGS